MASSSSLLLGPTARSAVLAKTFVEPAREYHLRELVRLTGLAPRTIHQEVDRLVDAGLLAERRAGNRRYLHANTHHPLFAPVREIVLKTAGLGDVLRDALTEDDIDFALVYGSIAADTPRAASDVDLLIVGSLGLREAAARLRPAQDILGREVVPAVWTPAEFARRRRRHDGFLERVLGGPTIAIVGTVPAMK
ncbi:MAG: nucleotidyltransferase domain-containing protein [Gemmatimonadales bacterium]